MHLPRKPRVLGALLALVAGLLPGLARADVLYGVTFSNQLITIDQGTGAGTLVGNLDTNMAPYGIAAFGGNLYVFDQTAHLLRQIDPTTAHTIASTNLGATTSDLIGEGDVTFRADGAGFISTQSGGGSSSPSLIKFSLSPPGSISVGALRPAVMDGLAFSSSNTMYGVTQGNTNAAGSSLYTINPLTGVTTFVGSAIPNSNDAIFGGLAFRSDGTLFAEMANNSTYSRLFTMDPNTGIATLVGQISGFNDVAGLAFLGSGLGTAPLVPEPASAVLLAIGLGGVASWRLGARLRRAA
jgi:hypothetical protein